MKVLILVLTVLALAACGGEESPEEEIRSGQHEMFDALKDGDIAEFCAHTTNEKSCESDMAMFRAIFDEGGGSRKVLLDEHDESKLDESKITVAEDGGTATVKLPGRGDSPPDKWVLVDGEWKYFWEETDLFGESLVVF